MRQAAVEAQQEAECKATHQAAAQSGAGDSGVPRDWPVAKDTNHGLELLRRKYKMIFTSRA